MLTAMTKPVDKPSIDDLVFGPNTNLKLYAFMLREKDAVPFDTLEHIELTFGENEDAVTNALIRRYGHDLKGMEIKLVGALPADSVVMPIVEDLYYDQFYKKQKELEEIEKKLPAAKKKAFIENLKLSNEKWGAQLGKKDHKELTRLIDRLETKA